MMKVDDVRVKARSQIQAFNLKRLTILKTASVLFIFATLRNLHPTQPIFSTAWIHTKFLQLDPP